MKKNKHLSRAWFWSYVALIFGGLVPMLLAMKTSMAFAIILAVIATIDLGLIITAQVLYTKKRNLFPIFAACAQGILTCLVLGGFIAEIVMTAKGELAVYPWIVASISMAIMIFVDAVTTNYCIKIIRGETIIEGKQ